MNSSAVVIYASFCPSRLEARRSIIPSSTIRAVSLSKTQSAISAGRDSSRFPFSSRRTSRARVPTRRDSEEMLVFPSASTCSFLQENKLLGETLEGIRPPRGTADTEARRSPRAEMTAGCGKGPGVGVWSSSRDAAEACGSCSS